MLETIDRPLWRAFEERELAGAVKHAKRGGLAVVKGERWFLFGDAGPRDRDLPLYVDWAIRAIESPRWAELTEGPARGLVSALVKKSWYRRVDEWIDRDRPLARKGAATAKTSFDCMACAACCYDNEVLLDAEDLLRFKRSDRPELLRRTRRAELSSRNASLTGGKPGRLLPLDRRTRGCIHLNDTLCGIYEHRPNMCREFPIGTEQCITSREDKFGEPFPPGR